MVVLETSAGLIRSRVYPANLPETGNVTCSIRPEAIRLRRCPGGAIDGDETEEQALVREFVEETGLTVRPNARLGEAGQYFLKSDGRAVNNLAGFWTAEVEREDPSAKIEDDHELQWLDPQQALAQLRHDAHAWAVAMWLRRR